MILTCWNYFISKIEFKSQNELDKTDRQRNKAKIGLTLEKKKDSGFRKEEGREEEEKNKDGLTRERIMRTD